MGRIEKARLKSGMTSSQLGLIDSQTCQRLVRRTARKVFEDAAVFYLKKSSNAICIFFEKKPIYLCTGEFCAW